VTGEDLDWFWRSWFYETDNVDHAVANVTTGDTTTVTVEQKAELMLPMTVQLSFEDGSSNQRRIPAEAFFTKDTHTLTFTDRTLRQVQLDPNQLLPDVNPKNNSWTPGDAQSSSEMGQ
jgi:hypothetical protein